MRSITDESFVFVSGELRAYDLVLQSVEALRQQLDKPEELLGLMEIWDDLQRGRDDVVRDLEKIERSMRRKAVLS